MDRMDRMLHTVWSIVSWYAAYDMVKKSYRTYYMVLMTKNRNRIPLVTFRCKMFEF